MENSNEVARVLSSVPDNEKNVLLWNRRLLGRLIPFRAFGDFQFKWSRDILLHVQKHLSSEGNVDILLPSFYKSQPYVVAFPEVITHTLTSDDLCLLLTTDGLLDFLEIDVVADLVGRQLTGREKCGNLVTHIIASALQGLRDDSRLLKEYLRLPSKISRRYRDDMTAVVVSFV
ncbi:pyruvate dehydrogenase [acetyl-transferring]-phosphatase 1, mitochondrial-like [Octopus sinensis]|uniref:Pyruvate dehydrogenase [acetyl-transferring]-phosphatase 1, mitochondrial-like n=1 Tax=Octopus sinensis TaxID=2607531 RepID=A0A6P7U165_9MOLL|nr:pyruvate dehydrogenase [acetyl-transferring]-phosphatase 1, mitochondrial-like [Octopus sinensis]